MADIKVSFVIFLAHISMTCTYNTEQSLEEIFQQLDVLAKKVVTLESKNELLQEELNRQNGSLQEFKTKLVGDYSDLGRKQQLLKQELKGMKYKDFETIKNDVKEIRDSLKLTNVTLQNRADIQEGKIKTLETIQNNVSILSSKLGEAPPSFYAMLTSTVPIRGSNQTIIYDKTGTNNGNAYNTSTGIFTVPETGTYVFTWTAFSYVEEYVRLEIVVGGTIYGGTLSDTQETSDADTETAIVVVNANAGDEVFIRSQSEDPGHGHLYVEHECTSTFSGWKIS
ncbi:uncharacterized protein LOC133185222 [Saccostrea echinata]|uniref:uncharacterized protein LOC133185222 n=1 Tax=Saccostrea echinata TaxID=191078 RepID=UPI002A7EC4E2|nr:uncharacterized protein LOC133185222 [Saccostrea echinata]